MGLATYQKCTVLGPVSEFKNLLAALCCCAGLAVDCHRLRITGCRNMVRMLAKRREPGRNDMIFFFLSFFLSFLEGVLAQADGN